MGTNSNISIGKLLLVNDNNENFPDDYSLKLPEFTMQNMYYSYIEILIPTELLKIHDEVNDITLLKMSFNNYKENYSPNSGGIYINIQSYHNKNNFFYLNIQINTKNTVYNFSTGIDCQKFDSNNEYTVLSIMVLPKLNKNPNFSNFEDNFYNSLAFFINGKQVKFSNTYGYLLPVKLYYETDDTFFIRINDLYENYHIIFNTEYERFMYKNLADMCYNMGSNITGVPNLMDVSEPYTLGNSLNISGNILYKTWSDKFLFDKIKDKNEDSLADYFEIVIDADKLAEGKNIQIFFPTLYTGKTMSSSEYSSMNKIANFNFVDYMFLNEYSTTDSNDGSIERKDYYKSFPSGTDMLTIQINSIENNNYTIKIGSIYNGSTFEVIKEENDTKLLISIYMLVHNYSNFYKYYYLYAKCKFIEDNEYDIEFTRNNSLFNRDELVTEILATQTNYSGITILDSISESIDNNFIESSSFDVNFGHKKFHAYVSNLEMKPSTLSDSNIYWKTLWKYKRTLQFTTHLQDNPVIFPLELFSNNNKQENMFLEIITNRKNDSILEFAIGSGFDFYNNRDLGKIKNLNKGITNSIDNIENSNVSSIWYKLDEDIPSKTSQLINTDIIAFYYNHKNPNQISILYISNSEINSINIDINDLTVLKTLMIHLRSDNETIDADVDLGNITINFGPKSTYFQTYIDELLDND